jgi:hypothetical protein
MDHAYKYTEEKFSQARRHLMLPLRGKEGLAISQACSECSLALKNISHLEDGLDERARAYISQLKELIEREKILSDTDKHVLCELIDHLAYYFHDRWKEV